MKPLRNVFLAILVAMSAHAAIRVTPEAAVADPVPAPQEGQQYLSTIATDGDQFLVFWSGSAGVSLALVADNGRLLSRVTVPGTSGAINVSATWTGSIYLATWSDPSRNSLMVATFSRSGDLQSGPTAVAHGSSTRTGALASNGRRALLLYSAFGSGVVKGAVFDADGSLMKTDVPIPATGIASNLIDTVPFVASDGDEFAVVWRTGELVPIASSVTSGITAQSTPPPLRELFHDFHLLRVSEDGDVIGSQIDIGRTEQTGDFGVAFGAGVYAIASVEAHLIKPGQTQARLVRFTVDARGGSATRLPTIDVNGGPASVFWSGSGFVAYWLQHSPASFALKTLQFSGGAEDVAPQPSTIAGAERVGQAVTFASNGRNALGAWSQNTTPTTGLGLTIYGSLFDASAAAASAEAPLVVSVGWSRQVMPQMATSGTESLVVWIDESVGYEAGRLLGSRVAVSGAMIDRTPFEIATSVSRYNAPRVVFAGNAYFVVWGELSAKDATRSIVARSVGRDGSLGARIVLGDGNGLCAASNGTTTLVVFNNGHLVGYRFDALGKPIDTNPLVIRDGYSFAQRVASNGSDFFVAWSEGSDYWQWPSVNMIDVLGARVSAAGAVDAAALPIATGPSDQILAAVASDGRDYLVAYLVNDDPQHPLIAAKRVLREGQLDGATATDEGTIILHDALSFAINRDSFSLAGDAGRYWAAFGESTESGAIVRTDLRGAPVSAPLTVGPSWSWLALATAPGGALRMVYTRPVVDGVFAGTSRVFVRSAGDALASRYRAMRP
jgi:hypothetical protein